ncbi:HAD family hydrolase [Streptomyces xinghaiensis]|uniref:HAD family hydrolase n=1 Tax=Streptomyces xinghaiensis TaxID=1038928 RepID=UPI003792FE5D
MRPLVLFDLDNTLVDRQRALTDWVAGYQSHHGLSCEQRRWLFGLLADRATPAHFERIRNRFGLAESASSLWHGYCEDLAAAVICPPDVLSGIEELRTRGWRIGIVTNGATDIQTAKLRATGLADRVDAVCISGEAGVRKPDPALFRKAARRCGISGYEEGGWMVGDNPVNDIGGSRSAGFRTVWIHRGLPWPAGLPGPDHQVPDARAAIELLISCRRQRKELVP